MPQGESAEPQGPSLKRIVSGGQTGVDRAALDVAIELGMEHGGWCPRGRLAEDGAIPDRYNLQETQACEYTVRTERNVMDSDGTLILFRLRLQGGTALTDRLARSHGKPVMRVRLDSPVDIAAIHRWLIKHSICTLNVAGPRESSQPGIGQAARDVLRKLLSTPADRPLFPT